MLNEFAACHRHTINIIQVDNGLFHQAKKLQIPENIILREESFPPWEYLKQELRWELFEDLDNLRTIVAQLLAQLTPEVIASLTGYDYILNALSVPNIF